MGLDLAYDANGTLFTHRFSQVDWETIGALHSRLPKETAICFEVTEFGVPASIKTAELKESAAVIEKFLADNPKLLPATYQFKLERFPVPGVPVDDFGSGGISGLRLPNDQLHFYAIDAGLNLCKLTKMAAGPDGRGVVVEERDLRGETELITECSGRVQFRRQSAKTSLRCALRDIVAFADSVPSTEVTKIVG